MSVISTVATAADAHTDSGIGGLHITAHLLHTVQDTDGLWCLGRVMDPESEETLSNNTEYQERLRKTLVSTICMIQHVTIRAVCKVYISSLATGE